MAIFSEYKTEVIGISVEVAIADVFDIPVNITYRNRANEQVVKNTIPVIHPAFKQYKLPYPIKHIAQGQNPVDFTLIGNKTLSVKSNQHQLGKVAPQNVGQPTSSTFWAYFRDFADGDIPGDYCGKAKLFKRVTIARIDGLMTRYWENMFDCDYLLHFYDFLDSFGILKRQSPKFVCFSKKEPPEWRRDSFSFTQSEATWNEGNTVKYADVTIGEFQIHSNRDCFKFRFNMDGIAKLTEQNII